MKIMTKEQFQNKKLSSKKKMQYCYELCKSLGFDRKKMRVYAEMYEYSINSLYTNAKRYALEVLNMPMEEFAKEAGLKGTRYVDVLQKLLATGDPNEIKALLNVEGLNLVTLWERSKEYPRIHYKNLTSEEQDAMVKNLARKIRIVVDEQKELRRQELAKKLHEEQRESDIKKFGLFRDSINSSTIVERDLKRQLTTKTYERVLNLLKVEEPETYKLYMKKTSKYEKIASKKADELIKEKILKLLAYLTNGIEVDGKLEKFNLLNCYEIFRDYTKYLSGKVKLFEGVLPVESRAKIQQFLSHTHDAVLKGNELLDFLNEAFEFDCEKDENGNNIKGTGIIITREVKENWLIYLQENNIPITYYNLSILKEQTKNALRQEKAKEKKKM